MVFDEDEGVFGEGLGRLEGPAEEEEGGGGGGGGD